MTETGQKIEDLWLYRGLVLHNRPSIIRIPPLRERSGDIPLLAEFFLRKWRRRLNKSVNTIPAGTMTALVNYSWPDNILELEKIIERSVVSAEGHEVHLEIPAKKKRA